MRNFVLLPLFAGITLFLFIFSPQVASAVTLPSQALEHRPVCSPGNPDTARCHAHVITDTKGKPHVSASPSGYGPQEFIGAYSLSATVPTARTIAIVDAYNHPTIAADLQTYSNQYGLTQLGNCSIAQGTATQPCFQKVDQRGGTSYPATDSGWALEIALDVQAAHAICQNCNILLVEADSSSYTNLTTAVDRAVAMGANIVSNSYGSGEFYGETAYDSHFNKPGVAFTFSSGDNGYGVEYPAASRYVTAVGGTSLTLSGTTRVSETAWKGAGSGCSSYETKPTWQKDTGCNRRTVADVSADADPYTGAAVYDSVSYNGQTGWFTVGGTSLAAPIIAGVYALQRDVTTSTPANSLPYSRVLYNSNLFDVTSGANGRCRRNPYLCTAQSNYDGPTGLGTPLTSSAF